MMSRSSSDCQLFNAIIGFLNLSGIVNCVTKPLPSLCLCLCICLLVGQAMFPHHSEQLPERWNVSTSPLHLQTTYTKYNQPILTSCWCPLFCSLKVKECILNSLCSWRLNLSHLALGWAREFMKRKRQIPPDEEWKGWPWPSVPFSFPVGPIGAFLWNCSVSSKKPKLRRRWNQSSEDTEIKTSLTHSLYHWQGHLLSCP